MSATGKRKQIGGVELCADPARETCFTVVQTDSEMVTIEDAVSPAGRRERLHRHMNNEVGSMEIAAQMLVDFPDAPWDLRIELARQTFDESRHVEALHRRLQQVGGRKGEFPIANFEWSVTNMQDTIAARLAIQNRTFEAGQMDLLGSLSKVWRASGDDRTAELLEAILADEVNHVRFANRWIRRFAQEDGRVLLRVAKAIRFLAEANAANFNAEPTGTKDKVFKSHAQMGVNVDDRRRAEFSEEEIKEILRQSGMRSVLADAQQGAL